MAQRRVDTRFAGDVLRAYVKAVYGGPYKMAEAISYPAATFYAVVGGDRYPVDHANVNRLEIALDLPLGTFERLALRDLDGLSEDGAPAALQSLARRASGAEAARAGERRRTRRAI